MQDVRLKIDKVRAEVDRVSVELKKDIEKVKYGLLKRQIGGWLLRSSWQRASAGSASRCRVPYFMMVCICQDS